MARARISTTVDQGLVARAREAHGVGTDASLVEEALRSLLADHRRAEIDASYSAYDVHPINEPDGWGDLASWRAAAAAS